jgi:hypothetical protein
MNGILLGINEERYRGKILTNKIANYNNSNATEN